MKKYNIKTWAKATSIRAIKTVAQAAVAFLLAGVVSLLTSAVDPAGAQCRGGLRLC